jgi:hypothetical protein
MYNNKPTTTTTTVAADKKNGTYNWFVVRELLSAVDQTENSSNNALCTIVGLS